MSIIHFEALHAAELEYVVKNLDNFEVTEKLDGAQMYIGIDDLGFYSRRDFPRQRFYTPDEYSIDFSTTYRRAGHTALSHFLPNLVATGMKEGDEVEVEVLHGEIPNVVSYSVDTNFIVFLRTISGDVDIDRLAQELDGHSIKVSIDTPVTVDGIQSTVEHKESFWKFARSPKVDIDLALVEQSIKDHVDNLSNFLDRNSAIAGISNRTLDTVHIGQIPKILRELVKAERAAERQSVIDYALQIKEVLLDNIVRNRGSKFGPPDGWIEGVVFRNKTTGKMFKLVDKTVFGTAHKFIWKIRNSTDDIVDPSGLTAFIDKYNKEKHTFRIHIDEINRTFTYDGEVHKRTLEFFAFRHSRMS